MSITEKEKCVICGSYIEPDKEIFCDFDAEGPLCSLECLKEHKKDHKERV